MSVLSCLSGWHWHRRDVALLPLLLAVASGCKGSSHKPATKVRVPDQRQAGSSIAPDTRPGPGEPVLTVVYDNFLAKQGLQVGGGFACVVQGLQRTVLFDTGMDGATLLANMGKLGLDPAEVDVVMLSHFHFDHTGGLDAFVRRNPKVALYLLASFPRDYRRRVAGRVSSVVEVKGPVELFAGAHSLGEMGTAPPEHALAIETAKGAVVLTGCAHPGIVAIAAEARRLLHTEILAVIGGFHLRGSTEDEIAGVADALLRLGVKHAGPSHCSGQRARAIFKRKFRERYLEIGVGAVVATADL
jgi:7,8-dihydropterin-6-yl-methyl-4-(beta-D-ribofuranosyl)aminobenzene 5'-phosphate synthase